MREHHVRVSPPLPPPPPERLPIRFVPTDDFGTAFFSGLAALEAAFLGCCAAFFSCFVPP